jgi:hypothetical protein
MMEKNKTSTNPTKERKPAMNETLTRDNLRQFAKEINAQGIKDLQGFIVTGKTKEELQEACEDAVHEIFSSKQQGVYEGGLLTGAARAVWERLAAPHLQKAGKKKAEKPAEESRESCSFELVGERMSSALSDPSAEEPHETIEEVVAKVTATPKLPRVQQGTGGKTQRSKKGEAHRWLRERLERCQASLPTLIEEMKIRYPHLSDHSVKTFLYGARTPKFNKCGVPITMDKQTQIYTIG